MYKLGLLDELLDELELDGFDIVLGDNGTMTKAEHDDIIIVPADSTSKTEVIIVIFVIVRDCYLILISISFPRLPVCLC